VTLMYFGDYFGKMRSTPYTLQKVHETKSQPEVFRLA
jgi:hypothetical protein